MRVVFRVPRRREIELPGSWRVEDILRDLDLNPETFLVIRDNRLLTDDDVVADGEVVELRPAISGG